VAFKIYDESDNKLCREIMRKTMNHIRLTYLIADTVLHARRPVNYTGILGCPYILGYERPLTGGKYPIRVFTFLSLGGNFPYVREALC
jgi:hypothetical protein